MGHNHPDGARAHLGASALLHLHGVHLRLWCDGAACVPRSSSGGSPGSGLLVGNNYSAQRVPLRPDRAQEDVHHWRCHDGSVWLHLFRAYRYRLLGVDLHCDGAFSDPARYAIRASGSTHRRKLHARLRYSGASIGYQLASITAGGPAPLIATALFATYKSGTPIAIYILITAVISIAATTFLKDYAGKDVSAEYDH